MEDGSYSASGAKRAVDWSIGLDFGTAFSKAAGTVIMSTEAATLRQVRPLRIGATAGGNRPYLVPSSIFLDRQRIHFGPRAITRLVAANVEDRELVRSFKRVLGANDPEDALNRFPRASVDPDRMFRLRELITLYLAYLLALVDTTIAGATSRSRLRFTRPGWIPDRIAAAHEVMTALFNQAHVVHQILGDRLLAPDGLEYAIARDALDRARDTYTGFPALDGGIYEASAVGLCHYSDAMTPNYLLIMDVGAGTTDVAALVRAPYDNQICIVRAGRRTIETAGDHFDAALVDLLTAKAKLKADGERTALRNTVLPIIRELKEDLFANGTLQVSFRGKKFACTARELERRPMFRTAIKEINALFDECLAELVQAAQRDGVRSIGIVLAGGGSRIPALREAITKRRWTGLVRIRHLASTPAWVQALGAEKNFDYEPLFAQVSAAFGAAISAPEPPTSGEAADSKDTVTL
ncbi:MAG: rod shape-determining protein [Proteobacteria bacterium]|nr:rod shape-determining protein [Pseudomonadota bacterium]